MNGASSKRPDLDATRLLPPRHALSAFFLARPGWSFPFRLQREPLGTSSVVPTHGFIWDSSTFLTSQSKKPFHLVGHLRPFISSLQHRPGAIVQAVMSLQTRNAASLTESDLRRISENPSPTILSLCCASAWAPRLQNPMEWRSVASWRCWHGLVDLAIPAHSTRHPWIPRACPELQAKDDRSCHGQTALFIPDTRGSLLARMGTDLV